MVDVAEARRLGLTHLIRRIRVTPTPFGEKTDVEFYSRLDALKKLADLRNIRLPHSGEDDESLRAEFDYIVQNCMESEGFSREDATEFLLASFERVRPDAYEKYLRAGVKKSD